MSALRRLVRRPLAVACLVYLAVLVGIAVLAPMLLPDVSTENAGDLAALRESPSGEHPLGTDTLGRDVLDRILVGTRVTLTGVAQALVVVLVLGVPLGLAAGYYRGWLDRVVSWLADVSFAMPAIVVILVVLAAVPQSMSAAMVTLGVLSAPGLMRIVRSATLPVRAELYVSAARVAGLSGPYIIARHVWPRVAGAVIVQLSLLAAVALLVQSGLAFLDLVVPAPAPSWGGMVADGAGVIVMQPWLIWPPGMAIALTVLVLGLLADVARDTATERWAAPPVRRAVARPGVRTDAASASTALLSVEGLSVVFPAADGGTPVAVDEVSFDVRAGETVGLVGESGCGKTVTSTAVIGLLPGAGRVAAGRIRFAGRDLATASERELRRIRGSEIGLVSQEPMVSLNPAFRVGWQLARAVRLHHGVSRKAARARVVELLRQVRLPNPERVAGSYPHELSGGMAQRVSIARALAGEPRLLIADEPTTALDVTVQAEILDLLRDIQAERDMAILLVTHDWGVVADMCDRSVVMYAGQVVERAAVEPIFRQPLHPYTEALLAANPQHAGDTELLPMIPGAVPRAGEWPSGCHFQPRCAYATAACAERKVWMVRASHEHDTRCIHHARLAGATHE